MKRMIISAALVGGAVLTATGQQADAASGQEVVTKALAYRGVPYVYGAPAFSSSAFDCSSFTQFIFKKVLGVDLPRTSSAQSLVGKSVSVSQLQVGDLLFFDTSGDGGIHHVGIYIGNGQMVSAELTVGVHVANVFSGGGSQSYWQPRFKNARRVTGGTATQVSAGANKPATGTSAGQKTTASAYKVKSGDSLWAIASSHGLTVAKLKALNGLTSDLIHPGQTLKLTGNAALSQSKTAVPAKKTSTASQKNSVQASTYKVKSGDSLWAIAQKYGLSVSALKSANALKSDLIYPGETLKLSASSVKAAAKTTVASSSHAAKTYTVKSGDSLWEIATLHGISVNKLMRANNLTATLIYPGQHLMLP